MNNDDIKMQHYKLTMTKNKMEDELLMAKQIEVWKTSVYKSSN